MIQSLSELNDSSDVAVVERLTAVVEAVTEALEMEHSRSKASISGGKCAGTSRGAIMIMLHADRTVFSSTASTGISVFRSLRSLGSPASRQQPAGSGQWAVGSGQIER